MKESNNFKDNNYRLSLINKEGSLLNVKYVNNSSKELKSFNQESDRVLVESLRTGDGDLIDFKDLEFYLRKMEIPHTDWELDYVSKKPSEEPCLVVFDRKPKDIEKSGRLLLEFSSTGCCWRVSDSEFLESDLPTEFIGLGEETIWDWVKSVLDSIGVKDSLFSDVAKEECRKWYEACIKFYNK